MDPSTYVASNSLFDGLDADEKIILLASFTRHEFGAGDYVFQENTGGDSLYYVETGLVVVKRWITEGAVDKILLTAEPGDVFGEMSFVDGGVRTASAVAERESRVCCLSRADFDAYCAQNPSAGMKILDQLLKIVGQRLRGTTNAYIDAVQYNIQVSGCEALGFHHLITSSMAVEILLSSGATLAGTIITMEHSEAGHQVILRRKQGGLVMAPYHSIVSISFDADL